MWRTNLKILALTLGVLAFYTMIANVIPQLQSEVPAALDLTSNASPEALVAAGEKIYNGAGGCTACHGLGTRAPNMLTDYAGQGPIGARCGTREKGVDCKAYLYESMTQPTKFVVSGFEPIMPDMRRQLSEDQIWATVAYLESQGGEVTVTADDITRACGRWRRERAARWRRRHLHDGPGRALQRKGLRRLPPARRKGGTGRPVLRSHGRPPQGRLHPPRDPHA